MVRKACVVSAQRVLTYLVLVAEVSNNTIGIYCCSWKHSRYLHSSDHHLKSLKCVNLKMKG